MRTYEETHPWITFTLDLRKANYRLWMLLGEAQSKCHHLAGVPLLPSVAQELHKIYLARGVLATTAIEGNTLTEEEVLKRVEGALKLPPSKEYLGQEIDNIVEACNLISNQILSSNASNLSVDTLKKYNALVLRNLSLGDDVVPGEIREHSVGVGRYRGAPAEDCEYLLGKLCDWLNQGFAPIEGQELAFDILKSIVAHIYLAWIHPFGDGNGRTARLVEFQTLLSSGVPDNAAQLLSNHYNQTRSEYHRQLDRSPQTTDGIFGFIEYALQGFVDGLKDQIELVKMQQLSVHWVNYVYDRFRDTNSPTDLRRRRLILDLSSKKDPVSTSEIRYISPRIAEAYANKTDKTVQRDLNELKAMGLIVKTPRGFRAKSEIIRAFLPQRRSIEE
jgi:Fic family protein